MKHFIKDILKLKHILLFISICIISIAHSQTADRPNRRLLLRDEGKSQLSLEDFANPKNNWYVPVPAGRDIQLVGRGRVLIGTGNGYEERDIATGKKVNEVTKFTGTVSARRLRNGNTMLVGLNWLDKKGIVLAEVDSIGDIKRQVVYPGFNYVRLVRETTKGTFLITANDTVFEGNAAGNIIWGAKITSTKQPHAWQPLRLKNGKTLVSSGYAGNFQVFSKAGKLVQTITGPASVNPVFFSGYQIVANGNYVVTNWQGHGPNFGNSGTQVLEYTPKGELAWSWKQDPAKYSSVQGVIVLDGLDINKLHVENKKGVLAPVKR